MDSSDYALLVGRLGYGHCLFKKYRKSFESDFHVRLLKEGRSLSRLYKKYYI